jgi:hypothetical protein
MVCEFYFLSDFAGGEGIFTGFGREKLAGADGFSPFRRLLTPSVAVVFGAGRFTELCSFAMRYTPLAGSLS